MGLLRNVILAVLKWSSLASRLAFLLYQAYLQRFDRDNLPQSEGLVKKREEKEDMVKKREEDEEMVKEREKKLGLNR